MVGEDEERKVSSQQGPQIQKSGPSPKREYEDKKQTQTERGCIAPRGCCWVCSCTLYRVGSKNNCCSPVAREANATDRPRHCTSHPGERSRFATCQMQHQMHQMPLRCESLGAHARSASSCAYAQVTKLQLRDDRSLMANRESPALCDSPTCTYISKQGKFRQFLDQGRAVETDEAIQMAPTAVIDPGVGDDNGLSCKPKNEEKTVVIRPRPN